MHKRQMRHVVGLEIASQRVGFLVGSAVLVVIGLALIVRSAAGA